MKNKITAALLAIQLMAGMLNAAILPVLAADNTIMISSQEDFIRFAKNCTLDSWSQGKTVSLTCDLDFTDTDFVPVATFGGSFNGNGHTLSGVILESKGSYRGIFRYLQPGGTVTALNVKGKLTPGGSKSHIGGIVGENAGLLNNCTFNGIVKGETAVGGIAGSNTDTGRILSCTAEGSVSGENATGGIVGKNSGFIQDCTNYAAVNTVYEEKKNSMTDVDTDAGALLETYKTIEKENEEKSVLGHSDTGGIVGYSSGIVQGCTNHAAVGYQHVGYNVGGVAGRQSGYMLGCFNYGLVQARKDAGGIVGQAEPYVLLNTSESGLRDLRSELNRLHTMVNRFITDTDALGDAAETHLNGISDYAVTARDNAEVLLNRGTNFVDDNLAEINAQSAILSNTLDKLEPVFDTLETGCDDISSALTALSDAFDGLSLTAPDIEDDIDDITRAMSYMAGAGGSLKKAAARVSRAKYNLKDAIKTDDKTAIQNALTELSAAVADMITAHQTIKTKTEEIKTILQSRPEDFEAIGINAKKIAEALQEITTNTGTVIRSLQTVRQSLQTLATHTDVDFAAFKSAALNIEEAFRYLNDAMYYISHGLNNLGAGLEHMAGELTDFTNDLTEQLNTFSEKITDSTQKLAYAADDIHDAIEDIKNIVGDLADEEPLTFIKLGDDFKTASENLFDALSGISGELNGLRETVKAETDTISGDITAISNQFNLVMNLLLDELDSLQNGVRNLSDIVVDVSDENLESTRQGKLADCRNFGEVKADRNTGGIAGAMAVEYAKDPEDDIEKPNSLNFTYRSRAVLQTCINDGMITGKKDCTGGIVGLAEIGTVYACENYGDTESTGGNYTGGVVGKSESAVRKSYAKARVSGKRYVGGIAGCANIITACYAITPISGDENLGAVCGTADDSELLYHNYFVADDLGAIDGISYREKAEPISFEALQNTTGIPARFISFTVTFTADGEVADVQDMPYGTETAKIRYPSVPEKKDAFGSWPTPDAETVTENITLDCVYQPYITVLASDRKSENGKLALVLAEGQFTDKAELYVADSDKTAPAHAHGTVNIYDVTLHHTELTESDPITLRIANENKNKVTAWAETDGTWEKVKTTKKGKYVLLQATGTHNTLCLQYTEAGFSAAWLAALLPVIIASVFIVLKQRKKKQKAQTADNQ